MDKNKLPIYKISKAELFRAGEILRDEYDSFLSTKWDQAYELLGKWRAMHAYPLNTFQANIRSILKKLALDKKAIVAQRLKRLHSIVLKLSRFPNMRLERMQDIGGIRIILPSISDVYKVRTALKNSRWKHRLCREKDYIADPQKSGYRSFHMIYANNNIQAPPEFQGLYVEIQIRTRLQHIWATTVETIGTFIQHSLKSSQGPKEWLDYLALASAVFAGEEETKVSISFETYSTTELVSMLHKRTVELNAFSILNAFHRAVQINQTKRFKNKYILLKLDIEQHIGHITLFNQNKFEEASYEYGIFEKKRNRNQDAVLVSSSSLNELRKAYPNYFNDASDFIKQLSKIFRKYNLPEIVVPNGR